MAVTSTEQLKWIGKMLGRIQSMATAMHMEMEMEMGRRKVS